MNKVFWCFLRQFSVILLFSFVWISKAHCVFEQNPPSLGFHSPPQSFLIANGEQGLVWRYSTSDPGNNWQIPLFDDSTWALGYGGFYRYDYPLAAWYLEPVEQDYVRIRSHWFPNLYLHTEAKNTAPFNDSNSGLFRRPVVTTLKEGQKLGWQSAQWKKIDLPDGRIQLVSRWNSSEFLNAENNLRAGPVEPGWESSKWILEPTQFPLQAGEQRPVYIKSFWGSYLSARMRGSYDQASDEGFLSETAAYLDSNLDWTMGAHFRLNFLADQQSTAIPFGPLSLWARSEFSLQPGQEQDLVFWARGSRTMVIFINGIEAVNVRLGQAGYRYFALSSQARASLKTDGSANTIAVRVSVENSNGSPANEPWANLYFDLGLSFNSAMADMLMDENGFEFSPTLRDEVTLPIKEYLQEQGVSAAVLALSVDRELVLSRGFGYQDKDFTQTLSKDAVMRLASVDKVVTREVVEKMIGDQVMVPDPDHPGTKVVLGFDTKVFPLLVEYGLTPMNGFSPDAQADDISIQHLLNHYGWVSELPNFESRDILGGTRNEFYQDLGILPQDHQPIDNVRWTYSQALSHPPGTVISGAYNSNGYSILRFLIDQIARNELESDFETYTQALFADSGDLSVYIARQSVVDRTANSEPWYNDTVESHDRWIGLDNFFAIAASAPAMALFNDATAHQFDFAGSMLGSWSWLGRVYNTDLGDYISFAFMVNTGGYFDGAIGELKSTLRALPASAFSSMSSVGSSSSSSSSSTTSSSSSAGSSSSSSNFPCTSANSTTISGAMVVDSGQCLSYQHGGGYLRMGTWSTNANVYFDVKPCGASVLVDLLLPPNGWQSFDTSNQNCEHLIWVKQAANSFLLQLGSW